MQCNNYTSSTKTLPCISQNKSRVVLTTDLPLNQLVYTSFANVGFKSLTSGEIPKKIQQTFLKQIVDRYSNAYEHKSLGYRAAYLLQIAPESWLFGWLYNVLDDTSHSHVPYFHCYYLAEPLYTLRIEKVCACLQKGPVALVDGHNSEPLEPLILKDLNQYQAAKPGVVIPWEVREQIYTNLKQGKLIDIFIPVNEQQRVSYLPALQSQQQVTQDNSGDYSSPPLLPVNEQQKESVSDSDIQPQDNTPDNYSLLLHRKFILLLGISLGAATSIAVMFLLYVFFNTSISVPTHSETSTQNKNIN